MLENEKTRSKIETHLAEIQKKEPYRMRFKEWDWQTPIERENMKKSKDKCNDLLKRFFKELKNLDKSKCLEPAAGDGKATKDILISIFDQIDCFDISLEAVRLIEERQKRFR